MRITQVKAYGVGGEAGRPGWSGPAWVLVKVMTDEGMYGWGEATPACHPMTRTWVQAVEELGTFCVGEDPLKPQALSLKLYSNLIHRRNEAVCGIETACWDICGKAFGVPVHQLLGTRIRDRIKAYTRVRHERSGDPGSLAEGAQAAVSAGYTAMKFDPFGDAYLFMSPGERRKAVARVEAVRKAVGDDVDVILEFHHRFTAATAIELGRVMVDYHPLWIEAPVGPVDPAETSLHETVLVAQNQPCRVASCEFPHSVREVADYCATGVFDVCLADFVLMGGISQLKQAGDVTDAFRVGLAPHNIGSPIYTIAKIHVDATVPTFLIQEFYDDLAPSWVRGMITRGFPVVKDGCIDVPNDPGLGIELDEEVVRAHPLGDTRAANLYALRQ